MTADWVKEIKNFPKEYKEMMSGLLNKRQVELLDGAEIKSHEGMVFGGMYADWKKRKGYDIESLNNKKETNDE
tara:strand:- start:689 stop:907 length:219 start_codon:yes stop_codon:yes gene_type:complete